MPPGGSWEDASEKLCLSVQYQEQPDPTGGTTRFASYSFATSDGNQDLSSVYPAGTTISFDVTSSSAAPLFVSGAMADPVARFSGQTVEVQGKTTTVKFARSYDQQGNPVCEDGNTQTMTSFLGGGVMLDPDGTGQAAQELRRYTGAFFGSNAETNGLPQVAPDGSVSVQVAGCGDGDPSTKEGFFQGFLPASGLAQDGLDSTTINSVPSQAVDDMMQMDNNGQTDPSAAFAAASSAATTPQSVPGQPVTHATDNGVTIDYQLSYSAHTLTTKVNSAKARAAAKLVRSCRARHGHVRYHRGRGRAAGKLLCQAPPKRRHGKARH